MTYWLLSCAGKEVRIYSTLRDRALKFFFLLDLLADTLAVPEAKDWPRSCRHLITVWVKHFTMMRCYLGDYQTL